MGDIPGKLREPAIDAHRYLSSGVLNEADFILPLGNSKLRTKGQLKKKMW